MLHWSSLKRCHEIKRCLLTGRKAMTNIDSILKSRDITLPTKVHLVKAMVFPVVMYGCESWTIKKAERQRIDAFELWCWRRLQNWLIGKDPDAGKDWRQEEKGMTEDEMVGWHHRLDRQEFEQAPGVGDGQRSLACRSPWGHKESDMTEWMNWTELNWSSLSLIHLKLSSWPLLSLRLPGGSDGKASVCNAGDPGLIPGLGRSPGNGNPLQYSCLENPMDRGAW